MATLIQTLALAGCRKSDGTANASGFVFLYEHGTNIAAPGYKDEELLEVWTTTAGGIPLDAAGRANIWVNQQVDIVVSDSTGAQVASMIGFNPVIAETVVVENAGFTGAITDPATGAVSQGLGGETDLDTVLSRAAASLGPDFQFLSGSGATQRSYIQVINEWGVSVKSYGAKGNNLNDDGVAIQTAINAVIAGGGGIVLFPPGNYKSSQTPAMSGATGVTLRGSGIGATTLTQSAGGIGISTASCTDLVIERMSISSTANPSAGVSISIGTRTILRELGLFGFDNPVKFTGVGGSSAQVRSCVLTGNGAGASIGVQMDDVSGSAITDTSTNAVVSGISYGAASGKGFVENASINATTNGILFAASLTGFNFTVLGCPTLSLGPTNPFSILAANDPIIRQFGNGVDGTSTNVTSGGTVTPNRALGSHVIIVGTTTGSAYTVNVPTPAPVSGTQRGQVLYLTLKNSAGAPITGWGLAAGYHTSSGPSTVDTQITQYGFLYDTVAGVWREFARSVTT